MNGDDHNLNEDDLRPAYDLADLKGGIGGKHLERHCPNAEQVARRLLVLRLLCGIASTAPPRGILAELMTKWSESQKNQFIEKSQVLNQRMQEHLRSSGLWDELSPLERKFGSRNMTNLSHQEQIDFSWRAESAMVLMWAIKLVPELPPLDKITRPEILKKAPNTDIEGFVKNAHLRDSVAINDARELMQLWHWRSRTQGLIQEGRTLGPAHATAAEHGFHNFDDIVRAAAIFAHEKGLIREILDDDFVAFGKPYRNLSQEEWATVRSISRERHFAINWLCGYAPGNRWDETPTNT